MLAHILHVSRMHSGCIPLLAKTGHGSYVSLAAALLRGLALTRMHLVHVLDTSHARSGRVLHAFQTCACKRYLGAELYRI